MTRRLLIAATLFGLIALTAPAADDAAPNQLTDKEKADGWKLLFDGKTTDGWHNFKKEGVKPGWQVKDGASLCRRSAQCRRHRHHREVPMVRLGARLQHDREGQ